MDNRKFNGKKSSAAAIEAVTRANSMDEFEAREEIYKKMRPEIQQKFK